jgi:hypothetical protein
MEIIDVDGSYLQNRPNIAVKAGIAVGCLIFLA